MKLARLVQESVPLAVSLAYLIYTGTVGFAGMFALQELIIMKLIGAVQVVLKTVLFALDLPMTNVQPVQITFT